MSQEKATSWIDRVMERMPASQGGDTIIGHIGKARNAAIGKNIVQVADVLGKPQPGDGEEVAKAVQQLRAEFERLAPQLSERSRHVGADKIDTIEQELTKPDGSPSGDLLRAAGDWLVDNIPEIGSALLAVFLPEPVGRLIVSAGSATVEWIKNLRDRISS
jgi:hypothetical protein